MVVVVEISMVATGNCALLNWKPSPSAVFVPTTGAIVMSWAVDDGREEMVRYAFSFLLPILWTHIDCLFFANDDFVFFDGCDFSFFPTPMVVESGWMQCVQTSSRRKEVTFDFPMFFLIAERSEGRGKVPNKQED